MQPNDNRHINIPSRSNQPSSSIKPDHKLAVTLMREQINRLYDTQQDKQDGSEAKEVLPAVQVTSKSPSPQPAMPAAQPQEPQTQATNNKSSPQNIHPYERTHTNQYAEVDAEHWKRYHTAWQQYYQQYYERYYLAQMQARQQHQAAVFPKQSPDQALVSAKEDAKDPPPQTTDPKSAAKTIKQELTSKITNRAKKVRASKHFVPILSAAAVMILFLFLQYNRLFIAQVKAYVSPGAINPQNIILDATTDIKVSGEPRMIIPKINVDAPVVYGLTSVAEGPVQEALKGGITHYPLPGANARPGQNGNAVFLGHSSNDVFDDGDYKFVFVQLEQMTTGDKFYINYEGTRYTYTVTKTETILPTEVSKLIIDEGKPTATLVSCTPVGTAQKRFLVHADQVSPDPASATAPQQQNEDINEPNNITGNSPTLFDRLFGF